VLQLSDIKQGVRLNGIIPNETIEVIAATHIGDNAVELVYRTANGLGQHMLVRIAGFRSIKECDLEIKNINILIGSNGAGKTNFLSAFTLLNNLYAQNLDLHVAQNGMSTFFYNGLKVTEKISIKLHISDHLCEYCFLPGSNNKLINASDGYGGRGCGENGYGSQTTERNELSFRVYHFHDTSRNARIKHEQNISNCKTLLDDASNLAAFLYRLRTNYLSSYKKILETVQL